MLTVRFHAAIHQLLTDEARVRFAFVPAPATTYGLDPALGDLDLYVARDGRSDIPLALPSASELTVPAGPTVVDGFLWTYPAEVAAPSGEQQHLTQAIVVATAFGAPGHTPKLIHVEGTLGPPTLPRANLLRIDELPAPVLFQPTAAPPKIGSRVAVRGRLGVFRVLRGNAGFEVLCLRGTAAAAAPRHSRATRSAESKVLGEAGAAVRVLEAPVGETLVPEDAPAPFPTDDNPTTPEAAVEAALVADELDAGMLELEDHEATR